MRQGLDALRESIDKAKSSGNRTPTNYFGWKAGETKIIRFLSEAQDLFVLTLHDWVPCPDGNRRTFVCRKEFDQDCELCDKADIRKRESGYGIAVLREAVKEEADGRLKIVGYKDWTEEVDEDGQKKVRPFVGIVRQAPTNFWLYVDSAFERNGTIRDRDVEITRRGDDKNTSYVFYWCDPVEIPAPDGETDFAARYTKYMPDLKSLLEGMGSAEYYAKHLHGQGGGDERAESAATGSSTPSAPATSVETEFDRLRKEQARIAAEQGSAPAGIY